MKKEEWNEGLNNIDSDLVEKYVEQKDRAVIKKKRRTMIVRIVSAAACFALILSAIIVVPMLTEDDIPVDIPVWDDAEYSAGDIAELFERQNYGGTATNAYVEHYVPDPKYLYIDEMPSDEYLNVYQFNLQKRPLDKGEFKDFIDSFLPDIADSLDINLPKYEIEKDENYFGVDIESGSYRMFINQNEIRHRFWLRKLNTSEQKMILDGETVQIDQRMSDEEIINSLKSVKNKLFDIFNMSFSDAKVVRYFGAYSEYGATSISVYFYDENAHPLNLLREAPMSDRIWIHFYNVANYEGATVSDSILKVADIEFIKTRVDINKEYEVIGEAKKISLEDAEKLLYNGYVFGGHSCSLCMAAQEKISFYNYDFVDIEYVFGVDYPTKGIPFYAFYKKIGTAKNGNICYAKTYVAAIEVSGYKEYFESQKDSHKNTNEYFD